MRQSLDERRDKLEQNTRQQDPIQRMDEKRAGSRWRWSGFFAGIAVSAFAFHGVVGMGDLATWASGYSVLAPHAGQVAFVGSGLIGIAFVYSLYVLSRSAVPLGKAVFNPRNPHWPRSGSFAMGVPIGVILGLGPDRFLLEVQERFGLGVAG
ncbi:MAG: hypothetical protein AAGH74_07940 [Pseudomonadota bacterium]